MSIIKSNFHERCKAGKIPGQDNDNRLYLYYSLLAKNRFRWEGLPHTIKSRQIEDFLYTNGEVTFFEDKDEDSEALLCLPSQPAGMYNKLGEPLNVTVTGYNFSKVLNLKGGGVRCLSNDDSIPACIYVDYYTSLIASLEDSYEFNAVQQKFPYVFPTSEEGKMSAKAMFTKTQIGEPVIYVDEASKYGRDTMKVIKTEAPYLLDKLFSSKEDIKTELLTYLGLNNAKTEKKERMLVDEINVNNAHIQMSLDLEYKNRLEACEKINELYGKKYGFEAKVYKVVDELVEEKPQSNFLEE